MPKKLFYRKSNKLYPENWHDEIERFEKEINDPSYHFKRQMRILKKQEEDEEALLDANGNYCGHKDKGWFGHQFVCGDWGLIFDKGSYGSVGYFFKNHVMRPTRKKK